MTRTASPDPAQITLFTDEDLGLPPPRSGRVSQRAVEQAAREAELAEWVARFERVEIEGRNEVSAGRFAPAVWLGWKCPACGTVEPNDFLLGNNHGYHLYDTHVPYRAEFGATCFRLQLEKNHRIYDERMALIRHLIDAGLDDEEISGRIGGMWPPSMIAQDRAKFAKEARQAAKAAKGEPVKVGHGSDCPCSFCNATCTGPCCVPDPQGVLL